MKNILVLSCLFLLAACSPKELPTVVNIGDEYVEVKVSHQTTQDEIEGIVKELKEKHNVVLDYEGTTFFDNGRLRDVKFKVTLPNGTGGKSSVMLAHIQYQYFGFEIDFKEGAKKSFRIGTM